MQSYRVINKVINFKKENKHLPILVAKRSREIMVVKLLDVQYGRPGAIVRLQPRLQRTLGTQPRPQGLLGGVVSPPKIGCSYTGAFPQISLWGNNLGCSSGFRLRSCLRLHSDQSPKGKTKLELGFAGNAIVKASQEQKTLNAEVYSVLN